MAAEKLNNSRAILIFTIYSKGRLNFHRVCHMQPCMHVANLSLTWTHRGRKKKIETFRQRETGTERRERGGRGSWHEPQKMKGQAPVIKSPWAAIDFSLASITPTSKRWTRFIYRVYEYRRGGYANLSSRPLLTKFQ